MMDLAQRISEKFEDRRLKLNVGGVVFETMRSTLRRRPATRLAQLAERLESDETWDLENREYFFDRHPGVFSSILHSYRSDELHTEHNLCGNIIKTVSLDHCFAVCLFKLKATYNYYWCVLIYTFKGIDRYYCYTFGMSRPNH